MNEDIKRLDGETQDQYFYRICSMKDALGFTWPQMADLFNKEFGEDNGNSAYRKRWNSFERIFKANEDKIVDCDNHIEDIRNERRELEKERKKLQATKVEINRAITHESRLELFFENMSSTIDILDPPHVITGKSDYLVDYGKEYVLCIADIQAGAKFNVAGNEYSLKVCEERFNKLLDMIVEYVQFNNIDRLHILELGDAVQGLLRINDLKLNETSVVEAVITVSRLISQFLNQLSAYCNIEYYQTPTSNHSQNRVLGSKANELVFEDMEYIIGNYINDMLINNKRINVHLNNGYDYIELPIFNYNVMAMHGHTIKNLDTALRDLSSTHRKLVDYLFVGHWHNGKVIPGNEHEHHDTEVLMCPSFQGTNPYAFNKLGKSSKAACKIFVFDRTYGCTGTEKFILN